MNIYLAYDHSLETLPCFVRFRTPWHLNKVYGRKSVGLELFGKFLYKLETRKPSFTPKTYLLSIFGKRGKLRGFGLLLVQIFRK